MHPSRLGQGHWALPPTGEGGQPSKPPTRRTSEDAPSPRSRRLSCLGATPASEQCCRQHVLSRRLTPPARTGTKRRDPPAPSVAVNMQTADNHEPSTHVYRRPLIQISRGTGPPSRCVQRNDGRICSLLLPLPPKRSAYWTIGGTSLRGCAAHLSLLTHAKANTLFWFEMSGVLFLGVSRIPYPAKPSISPVRRKEKKREKFKAKGKE